MTGKSLFGLFISLLLLFSVLFCGCSDESPPEEPGTPVATLATAKYSEGDIIATASSQGSSSLYLILKYDPATDKYTRAIIDKNEDGSWGHRSSDWTEKSSRASIEKTYTVKVAHVAVSIVPIVTHEILAESTRAAASGKAPVISKVSPAFAAKDTVVSVTISGSDFMDGATVRLVRAGAVPIEGTVTSVTAFDISCFFNLHGKNEGTYNLLIVNPDGQTDSRQDAFTIGESSPIISGMMPVTGAVGDRLPVTITGQGFRNEVKVSLVKNTTELVCDNPLSMESSKILCTLDLSASRGASAGEWTVTVINIRDGKKGTWIKKFVVTNATG